MPSELASEQDTCRTRTKRLPPMLRFPTNGTFARGLHIQMRTTRVITMLHYEYANK
jgi:hypothetical protein